MAYPLSLSMTAVLAIAGVGLGVHLGRDSIGQINPSFYDESPSSSFYASLVPNAPSLEASGIRTPQHPDAVVLDESGSCASCGRDGGAVYMADGKGYGPAYAEWSEPAPPVLHAAQSYAEPAAVATDPAIGDIERYAHYPVRAEEAQQVTMQEIAYAEAE